MKTKIFQSVDQEILLHTVIDLFHIKLDSHHALPGRGPVKIKHEFMSQKNIVRDTPAAYESTLLQRDEMRDN